MKAKDLAKLLLQNPEMDVVLNDSECGVIIVDGVKWCKQIDESTPWSTVKTLANTDDIENLRKDVMNFNEAQILAEFEKTQHGNNAESYKQILLEKRSILDYQVKLLEKLDAADYILSITGYNEAK